MSLSITLRLAIVANALTGDPRAAARLARQNGFAGLVFDVWSNSLSLPSLSDSGRRELRRIVSSENQQIVAAQMDLSAKGFGPGADVDRQLHRIESALESATSLQAPLLCIDLGPLPRVASTAPPPKSSVSQELAGLIIIPAAAPAPPPAPAPAPDPTFVSQVNAALVEVGNYADRYRMTIAFSSSLCSFASLSRALADADCPWFGIDLDPVAMLRDDWSPDEIFSAIGPLVRHVRGRDAVVGADKRTKPAPVGKGDTSWPALLALLDEAGYNGSITLDPVELADRASAALAGAKHLRTL